MDGWCALPPAESIIDLLRIMASTPQQGWHRVAAFGMRETLAELGSKPGAQLAVLKQMNQTLADLGIDWVRVEAIQQEQAPALGGASYVFTLSFPDRGSEEHRIET